MFFKINKKENNINIKKLHNFSNFDLKLNLNWAGPTCIGPDQDL